MPAKYMATLAGADHELEVEELAATSLRIKLGADQFDVDVRRVGLASFSILVDNRCFDLDVIPDGDEIIVTSRGGTTRVTLVDTARRPRRGADAARAQAAGRVELRAMMPGRVVNVLVKAGDAVTFQQGVVVVEAMKMENELKSPKEGKVAEVKVAPGQTVEKGDVLIVIE
jgi:biotin carboxyl carrier protein